MSEVSSEDLFQVDTHTSSENRNIVIQTHCGKFNINDVMAISLLNSYYVNKNQKVQIIRSSDPELFDKADILVGVGGIYCPEESKYDPVNREITFDPDTTVQLKTAGIIWFHYGKELVEMFMEKSNINVDSEEEVTSIYNDIYHHLIEETDKENSLLHFPGQTSNMNLTSIVKSMNADDVTDDAAQMLKFQQAVSLACSILEIKFGELISTYFQRKNDMTKVRVILDSTKDGANYIVVKEWIPTIYPCLQELDNNYNIKFIIFVGDDTYIVEPRRKYGELKPIIPLITEKMLWNEGIEFIEATDKKIICRNLEGAVRTIAVSTQRSLHRTYRPMPDLSYIEPDNSRYNVLGFIGGIILSFGAGYLLANSNHD